MAENQPTKNDAGDPPREIEVTVKEVIGNGDWVAVVLPDGTTRKARVQR